MKMKIERCTMRGLMTMWPVTRAVTRLLPLLQTSSDCGPECAPQQRGKVQQQVAQLPGAIAWTTMPCHRRRDHDAMMERDGMAQISP